MNTIFKIIGVLIVVIGLAAVFSPDVRNALAGITKTFQNDAEEAQTLSKTEVQTLIKNDMQRFAISINKKNMGTFYEHISDFWKSKTSVNALNEVFVAFMNSGIDLTILDNAKIVIDKGPTVTKNSDIQVSGHYKTTPLSVNFKQIYSLQKTGEWKLSEFFIDINNK